MFYAIPGWITLGCLVALLIFYPNRAASKASPSSADA